MTAHYPSSAELATFRRSIAGARFEWETAPFVDEREFGIGDIGWDASPDPNGPVGYETAPLLPYIISARREAARMRSAAFARGGMVGGFLSDGTRLVECVAQGCVYLYDPRAFRHHTVDCRAWRRDDANERFRASN